MSSGFARRAIRTAVKVIVLAAIVGAIVYRVRFAPVAVEVHAAQAGSLVAEVMGTGTLEARTGVTISSKIPGRLVSVLVDQGDRITKGQLLAVLDDEELKQQVEMATAALAAARAGVERAAADVARAEASVRQARLEYERNESLRGTGAVSTLEVDKSTEQYRIAQADLDRAIAAKIEMERQVITAEQTLKYHQARLADTKIHSPYEGLVIRRERVAGDVVVPGAAILRTISTEQLWVSAWVDESAMANLSAGQSARVVFRSEPDRSYPGRVARLAPQTDRETREFLVDVTVEELPKTWAIGQRAEVYIETTRKHDVLALPQRMIVWREGKSGVYVSEAGKAKWREVQLGVRGRLLGSASGPTDGRRQIQQGGVVEIIDGLEAGEQVIKPQEGKASLRDGRAVKGI